MAQLSVSPAGVQVEPPLPLAQFLEKLKLPTLTWAERSAVLDTWVTASRRFIRAPAVKARVARA
jgi:hypothetical protein